MALAVANQISGNNKQAISVVDAFIGTQDAKARQRDYGQSSATWSTNMSTASATYLALVNH